MMTRAQRAAVAYCLAACREGRGVRIVAETVRHRDIIDCGKNYFFSTDGQRMAMIPLDSTNVFRPSLLARLRLRWAARKVK